jgi:hypothetical protein
LVKQVPALCISQVAVAEAWELMGKVASEALAAEPMEREQNQVEMWALHLQVAVAVAQVLMTSVNLVHQKQSPTLQVAQVVRVSL